MELIESGATLHTRQHAESVHQNDALRSTRTRAGSIAHSGDRLVSYVKRGALMPDVAEAVQHLAVVGRVRIPVLHAELRRGDEGMTLEVADLSRPLARLWARYAIPAKTSSVPPGRGYWAGPSAGVEMGRILIRSMRVPARPFNADEATLRERLAAADVASERLVKALGA
jgi:hypothetical protein